MGTRLRVAVIGLGRRWQRRYRPAISTLKNLYAIGAVCDPVPARAEAEARRLGCRTAGLAAIVERRDIDVLLLPDGQWFGLWPIELACAAGKPVFCAAPVEQDRSHLEPIVRRVREASLPVMIEMVPRVAPQVARLRELLATELGQPLLARCEAVGPATPATAIGQQSYAQESLVPLIDWCVSIFQAEPLGSSPATLGAQQSCALDFGAGRRAELVRRFAPTSPHMRFEVFATHGRVMAQTPGHVTWTTRTGHHVHLVRNRGAVGRALLERFHHGIITGAPPEPTLEDAYRLAQWLDATSPA